MYKIQTITAGSAVASLDFTVPSGYDDLLVVISGRASGSPDIYMTINGSTANMSRRDLYGDGVNAGSSSASDNYIGFNGWSSATANTFASLQLYISNYLSSNAKSYSVESVYENNATQAGQRILAGLWNQTAAITSLSFTTNGNFVQGSTATLYGIRKYNTTATPKATGGIITYADGYFYHTFTASGTFTPTQTISCDYLVVAGGGGAGYSRGGGGGAGGYRTGSASLSATGYTVTVGAGGTGGTNTGVATSGGNSVFNGVTSAGGGKGGDVNANGTAGGSGGGATEGQTGGAGNTPSTSPSQGNNGGNGLISPNFGAGGGGGASAVGSIGSGNAGGNGGAGSQWLNGSYYAGGGGGGSNDNATAGTGGIGGGGNGGASSNAAGSPGEVGTGGGGGGGRNNTVAAAGGAGGSGIVIVRYAA